MKTELQRKLLDKYPEFFQTNKKIYIGEKSMIEEVAEMVRQKEMVEPIQFGIDCGDGWYVILDTLMGQIRWHIQNENISRANVFKYHWMWTLQAFIRRKYYKVKKLNALAEWLYEKAPRKNPVPVILNITQIKEKYGGLCFYYHGGDDAIHGMVNLAESLSYKTCETCGTTKNVGRTRGWIYTCCEDCYNKNERAFNLKWKPLGESFDEDKLF